MIYKLVFPSLAAGKSTGMVGVNATSIRCITGNASFKVEGWWQGQKLLDLDGFSAGLGVTQIWREVSSISRDGSTINRHEQAQVDTINITQGSTTQTIELWVGDGITEDNRLVGTISAAGGFNINGSSAQKSFGQIAIPQNVATKIWSAMTNGDAFGRVRNISAHDVWIGFDNTVTTATGTLLEGTTSTSPDGNSPGTLIEFLPASLDLWGITAAVAGARVSFLQEGN